MSHAQFFAQVRSISADSRFSGLDLERRHELLRIELEALSNDLRLAILACDPRALISAIWTLSLADNLVRQELDEGRMSRISCEVAFTLEYVHAVVSSHELSKFKCRRSGKMANRVLSVATRLRALTSVYCSTVARRVPDGYLGNTDEMLVFHAMNSWVGTRGYRYQTAERVFFEFALSPHDEALRAAYGIDGPAIARALQQIFNGAVALDTAAEEVLWASARRLAECGELTLETAQQLLGPTYVAWIRQPASTSKLQTPLTRDVSDSGLPMALLDDISFNPGAETKFFSEGALCGTPLRTLPGRERPLVKIHGRYIACDPYFLRDSAYRSIQWGLLRRLPDYQHQWNERQKALTENAFSRIFARQLAGADILPSVEHRDPATGKWCECDLVILIDDVMLVIEVRAGVMVMHSPEENFDGYLDRVKKLVIKAHDQCSRFIEYLAQADEMPVYEKRGGERHESRRLNLSSYRLVLPIGLTMEAFTPISSFCKELDEVKPVLGRHPFMSMSVDDLFVLSHFLPTAGELMHYLSVRQRIAGIRGAFLYDEVDHLGMYVDKNRFDLFAALVGGRSAMLFDGASADINRYFQQIDWESSTPPRQALSPFFENLLKAIDKRRRRGFLAADSLIRDLGPSRRDALASALDAAVTSLMVVPYKIVTMLGPDPVLVWIQRANYVDVLKEHAVVAEAVALAMCTKQCKVLVLSVTPDGQLDDAWAGSVPVPQKTRRDYRSCLSGAVGLLMQAGRSLVPELGSPWVKAS